MPGTVTTKNIKDGDGNTIAVRVWDESGAGTGPFSFFHILGADGAKLAKAEDSSHSSGDEGILAMALRKDTAVALGADNDYTLLLTDANGRLHVVQSAGTAGDVAHDGSDSGNPVKIGYKAIAHGSNPTAVAADDRTNAYANRHGIPFVIGGHPNVIARSAQISDADGAQTDASLVGSISGGTKLVITRLSIYCDNANSGDTSVKVGFGTSTLPASTEAGAADIIFEGSFDGGAGITIGDGAGIIAVGGDGAELRVTSGDPAGGNLNICFSYYTIES